MKVSSIVAGLALAAVVGSAAAASPLPVDGVKIVSGGTHIDFQQFDETHEYFEALQAFVAPAGFVGGTVFMMEPAGEPQNSSLGTGVSDMFTLVADPTTNHVSAYFISDGATANELAKFVGLSRTMSITETGQWQDVSAFFGQPGGFAQVISDVPEPTTWGLMLVGLGAIGVGLRRRRTALSFA
jgi:hypothetical protein